MMPCSRKYQIDPGRSSQGVHRNFTVMSSRVEILIVARTIYFLLPWLIHYLIDPRICTLYMYHCPRLKHTLSAALKISPSIASLGYLYPYFYKAPGFLHPRNGYFRALFPQWPKNPLDASDRFEALE